MKFHVSIRSTYLAEIGDIGVEILLVLFDDQVTFIFDLLTVAPLDRAVSELEQDGVVTIPSFEIDGQPCSTLSMPKGTSTFKVQTTRAEQRRSSSELLVVLLEDLECHSTSASVTRKNRGGGRVFPPFFCVFGTYFLSFLEFLTIFVDDGRDMLEVAHLDEVFC